MRIHTGTSGFSYKEWKGKFYPADLPASRMLSYYAERFDAVEINNTFYRMPTAEFLRKWLPEVPADFRFALKAPQQITHKQRLVGSEETVRHFSEVGGALEERLGPLLFQLPPYERKNMDKLKSFVAALPDDRRCAMEFRHVSWSDPEVLDVLRSRNVALCAADTEEVENPDTLLQSTSDWGYLRLRRLDYDEAMVRAWLDRVCAQPWSEAFVFFKHEDEARGPEFAVRFKELVSSESPEC